MTTAQDIIEAAYSRSTGNDPGKLAEDAELLAHLNRLHDRFVALLLRARTDVYNEITTLPALAGAPPAAAIATAPLDILHVANAAGGKVHLIGAEQRDMLIYSAPAVYRTLGGLRSRAKADDPVVGDVLTITILSVPAQLTTLTGGTGTIDPRLPVRHHQLLIDALALYLSAKDEDREQEEHEKMTQEYMQSLGAFKAEFNIPPEALERLMPPAAAGAR